MLGYNEKVSFLNKYITFIIAIGPLFTQYVAFFDFILLPEIFILPFLPLYILSKKEIYFGIFKQLIFYIFVVAFFSLIAILIQEHIDTVSASTAFLRFLFYALIIIFISPVSFNINYGSKVVIAVAALNSIYGLIQYTAYMSTGRILPWHLSFLKVKYGTKLIEEQNYYFSEFGYRFSGLFSEPAHFSQYLSLALLIVLFYKSEGFNLKSTTKLLLTFLFGVTMILSGSGTGFVMLLFCMTLLIISKLFSRNKTISSVLKDLLIIFLFIIFLLIIINSTIFNSGLTRLSSFSEVSTANIRLLRPFSVYYDLPVIYKIIGVGYGNYGTYVFASGIATYYEISVNSAWTNTIGYILVGSGLIGLIAYLNIFINLFNKTIGFYKYLIIMLMVFAFFTEVPLSFQFVLIMSFVINNFRTYQGN